jgi:exodeoxyribonuclease X
MGACAETDRHDPQRWLCSHKCGVLLYPDCPNHKNQTLRYWLGLKLADPSLAQPHRAMGDAYVTAALVRACLRYRTADEMVDASSKPILLPRLTFGEHAMKPIAEVPWSYWDWLVNKSKGPWDQALAETAIRKLERRTKAVNRAVNRPESGD